MVESKKSLSTLNHLQFNIAPENMPSQNESSLPTIIFQGRAVKFRGCIRFGRSILLHDFSKHHGTKLANLRWRLVKPDLGWPWHDNRKMAIGVFPCFCCQTHLDLGFYYMTQCQMNIFDHHQPTRNGTFCPLQGGSPPCNVSQVLASCFSEDMERSMGFRRLRRRFWDIQTGFLVCKPWVTLYLLFFFHCYTVIP